MMGIVLERGFPTYPQRVPRGSDPRLEDAFGIGILGTKPASGTVIIEELGGRTSSHQKAYRLHICRQRGANCLP